MHAEDPVSIDIEVLVLIRRPVPSLVPGAPLEWPFGGLIVERVIQGEPDTYRRIGAFECDQGLNMPTACYREIKLV